MNQTKKLTISGLVIAMYVTLMYFTQSFAFGAYQVRIATSLYSLSYLFPFLVIPLGISNFISNLLMGGMGIFDILGGTAVGIITSFLVYVVRRMQLPKFLIIPIIILGPGLIVPIWLSSITGLPYLMLVVNLSIGQAFPAVTGYILIKAISGMEVKLYAN